MSTTGRALVAAAEAAALARVAAGRGRTALTVPVRADGLDRALTLVRRVVDLPADVLDQRGRGIASPEERQAEDAVHLTVLDLTDRVPATDAAGRRAAAAALATRLERSLHHAPEAATTVRAGATDATCFLLVDDDRAHDLRRRVAVAVGHRWRAADQVHVANLARFRTPPTVAGLLGVDRRRAPLRLALAPPELVWTDKLLSPPATEVVARFGS